MIRLRVELWLFTMIHGLPSRRPTEADLVASPEWQALKGKMADALEAHPAALKALRKAFETFDPTEPQEIEVKLRWLDEPEGRG